MHLIRVFPKSPNSCDTRIAPVSLRISRLKDYILSGLRVGILIYRIVVARGVDIAVEIWLQMGSVVVWRNILLREVLGSSVIASQSCDGPFSAFQQSCYLFSEQKNGEASQQKYEE